jgi:deoxyribonuclease V
MNIDIEALEVLQKGLAKKVIIPSTKEDYQLKSEDIIFSLDVQYVSEQAYVAVDAMHGSGELLGIFGSLQKVSFPYIPQFFSFREAPVLLAAIDLVREKTKLAPNLLLIDGHGIAHPRRFGVACYVGVELQIPTIGCAKEPLMKYEGNLGNERGSFISLYLENEEVGRVQRIQNGIKPVFTSAGHLISLETSCEIILQLSPFYRISEPLRRADHAARAYAKGETLPEMQII